MKTFLCIKILLFSACAAYGQRSALVFQTDFGEKDGAVAAMKGVAFTVSPELRMFDLTHDIPPFDVWEAAYRLNQTAPYWPVGTIFVSVVDPGVGSTRRSIVSKTRSGHFFVTPDNGTLTLIAESLGIEETRVINEGMNRRPDSEESYTFHGRDVYAYTAAKLAAGVIKFEDVGERLESDIIRIRYPKPQFSNNQVIGCIDVLDVQYGNIWTNIDTETFRKLNVNYGAEIHVSILEGDNLRYDDVMIFGKTFSDVDAGKPVAYLNSLLKFSIGLNLDSFARKFRISSGPEWRVILVNQKK